MASRTHTVPSLDRCRGRRVIVDSSGSDSGDGTEVEVFPLSRPTRWLGDDDFSDTSSSLEGHLRKLDLKHSRLDDEIQRLARASIDGAVRDTVEESFDLSIGDSSSSGSVDGPNLCEKEDPTELPLGSNWICDRKSNEMLLRAQESDTTEVDWPDLRIPRGLFQKLYDYQKSGVQWMGTLHQVGIGGVLGDDMGMGKTYMALTFLGGLMRTGVIRNALIVSPVSVLRSWEKEAQNVLTQCVHDVRIAVLSSTQSQQRDRILLKALEDESSNYLIITSYGQVRSATLSFVQSDCCFDYVVLDEGHQIKNPTSATSRACRRICRSRETHRLLLTGTPILNNLKELWALFDWATSGQILNKLKTFTNYFARPIEDARNKNATTHAIKLGQRVNKELQEKLKPYFLQRLKVDFLIDKLPSKNELVVWTHLSSKQRTMYSDFVDSKESVVSSILSGETRSPLEAVTWLKKLCGHPILAEELAINVGRLLATASPDDLVQQSAKLCILLSLIENFRQNGHRTLIFSQSTKMLDIIEKTLLSEGVELLRIDGSSKEQDRQRFVDDFNSNTSTTDAMLLSTKAAGVGLTLVGADRVIIYDPSWTPAEDSQAVDRCYRIGQTRDVVVYRLIAAGTVEEKMYEKQVHKDGIRRTVFTEDTSVERYFDKLELRKLFALGAPGVCEVMEKVQKATQGVESKWDQHEFVLSQSGVVGLSRHDGFYSQAAEEISDNEEPHEPLFSGKAAGAQVFGRAQRILEKESYSQVRARRQARQHLSNQVAVEGDKENAAVQVSVTDSGCNPNGAVGKDTPTELPVRTETEVAPCDVLQHVEELLTNGQPKRAMEIMVELLEGRYDELSKDERMQLHQQCSDTAVLLGISFS